MHLVCLTDESGIGPVIEVVISTPSIALVFCIDQKCKNGEFDGHSAIGYHRYLWFKRGPAFVPFDQFKL